MARSRLILALSACLLMAVLLSLATGRVGLGMELLMFDQQTQLIIWEIRLPRTLLALITGGVLGASGAILQGWLRNPLADPGVLGVSASAAVGSVAAIYFGFASYVWVAPLAGILGAIVGFWLLLQLIGRETGILLIILAGAALNAFCGAVTALLLNLAPNPFALQDMLFWLMGSFEHRSQQHILMVVPPVILGSLLLWKATRVLDVLALGEHTATTLGVDQRQLFYFVGAGTALVVGACVAVTGTIGFVGLVVPHLLRPLVAWQPRALVLPSAVGGALLLVLADIGVRLLPSGHELRIGVVTALIGGPFFVWMLRHVRRAEAVL
jgi:iron complex transport system permease protein